MKFLSSLFTSERVSKRTQAFAEHFKYGVITSSPPPSGFATNPIPHPHRLSESAAKFNQSGQGVGRRRSRYPRYQLDRLKMKSEGDRYGIGGAIYFPAYNPDSFRQLLSATLSPHELAQLSETYAPPSPMKLTFSLNSDNRRLLSLPGSRQRDNFTSVRDRKRSTRNASYPALAQAGSPAPHIAKGRDQILAHYLVLRRYDEEAASACQRAHQPTGSFLMRSRRTMLTPGLHCRQRVRTLALELLLWIYAESTAVGA
ncbi:hypothetical protein EV702DRAFT_1246740 [Suillus placidus]|uniref:Uncharacterized protein n=1 Tax=Suillus placidus TaxID=48579 RepID=A0A9P6ZMI5_9AGAM|nr:hypothetical protein EV702DRAFT_1246740 [Suillus placidus]